MGLGRLAAPRMGYLINQEKAWNKDRILEWFVRVDEQDIQNIPLGLRDEEDGLVWFFDQRGCYFARNGYRLAAQMLNREVEGLAIDMGW